MLVTLRVLREGEGARREGGGIGDGCFPMRGSGVRGGVDAEAVASLDDD